ncbi:MAG: iron-sulfur cluster assembly scaffold protein, partial [Erysipelotrichaceae bacterium]|nr:iron-sulfur cluster assembly scaffold protein [Erysipelotrichaceae bacterium]
GVACTISTASTSIMTQLVKGKSVEEAGVILDNYFRMIDGQDYDEELLDEAVCMKNVGKQANRIKCATIGWNGLKQLLEEGEKQ